MKAPLRGAYELEGIGTVAGLRRVLEIAILDTRGLDNGIGRARTLGYLVGVSLKALELGDLEDRIGVLEQALASALLQTYLLQAGARHGVPAMATRLLGSERLLERRVHRLIADKTAAREPAGPVLILAGTIAGAVVHRRD